MKKSIFLLTTLLIIWIAGSAYVYVCKIRNDCGKAPAETVITTIQPELSGADILQVPDKLTEITPPLPLTIYFNTGESTCVLSDPEEEQIETIADYLAGNPEKKVLVTGHADNTGSSLINEKISAQRAGFIRQQLVEMGVGPGLIETSAYGELEPVSDNDTPEGRAKNRRVEIKIN
ncbi:MAG: OmpA family protein [Bacteroidales bacterium]|nr:OmpA family protein [Bacteroidales bacterium]